MVKPLMRNYPSGDVNQKPLKAPPIEKIEGKEFLNATLRCYESSEERAAPISPISSQ